MHPSLRQRLAEVAKLFLKLGTTAFGGPAAHIGLMHNEVVRQRRWLSDQEFLNLVGATNLIPGPNSTEMAIHLGFLRAGWLGLVVGGLCFVIPATAIVLVFAWAYVRFGAKVQAAWLLYGVKPVVIAIIGQALWSLGRKAARNIPAAFVGTAVLILSFFRVNEMALLFIGGFAVMVSENAHRLRHRAGAVLLAPLAGLGFPGLAAASFSLPLMFFTFLKIGAVMYGSGYVLLAFLRADFVTRFGWLNDRQLLDAIAVGQVTPGPLFTAATFIGYLLGGFPGGMLATLGIFVPSFVFVAISNPLIPRLRKSTWTGGFLDGVNASALGLMAAVTWQLGRASLVDPQAVIVAIASLAFLLWSKINSVWLILAGGLFGLISGWLAG